MFQRFFWVCVLISLPIYAGSSSQAGWSNAFDAAHSRHGGFSIQPTVGKEGVEGKDSQFIFKESLFSYFVPFSNTNKSHFWWDTGSIWLSSRAGYRHVPKALASQKWFWGVYGAHVFSHVAGQRQVRVGAEWCSSHWGACAINFYTYPGMDPSKLPLFPQFVFEEDPIQQKKVVKVRFKKASVIDHWGISFQYTYPLLKVLEGSVLLAYSKVFCNTEGYVPQSVKHVAVGMQYALTDSMSLQLKYTLMNQFSDEKFTKNAEPDWSIGVRYGRGDANLNSDFCRRKLSRPPEIYAPHHVRIGNPTELELRNYQVELLAQQYVDSLRAADPTDPDFAKVKADDIAKASEKEFRRQHVTEYSPKLNSDKSSSKGSQEQRSKLLATLNDQYGKLCEAKEKLEKAGKKQNT